VNVCWGVSKAVGWQRKTSVGRPWKAIVRVWNRSLDLALSRHRIFSRVDLGRGTASMLEHKMVVEEVMIARRRDGASIPFREGSLPGRPSLVLVLAALSVYGGCNPSSKEMQPGGSPMSIEVTSTAFQQGMNIPKQYTGDGADQSPPLRWSELPTRTKSIALICDDPDAPRGTWVHWVLFNLPPQARELEEGISTTATLPSGAKQGKNDFGNIGYGGPAPPKGKAHRYFFKLYALEVAIDLAFRSNEGPTGGSDEGTYSGRGTTAGDLQAINRWRLFVALGAYGQLIDPHRLLVRQKSWAEVRGQQKLVELHVREVSGPQDDVGPLDDHFTIEPTSDDAIGTGLVLFQVEAIELEQGLDTMPLVIHKECILAVVQLRVVTPLRGPWVRPWGMSLF